MVKLDPVDIQFTVEETDNVYVNISGWNTDACDGALFRREVKLQVVDPNAANPRGGDGIRIQTGTDVRLRSFEHHLPQGFEAVLNKQGYSSKHSTHHEQRQKPNPGMPAGPRPSLGLFLYTRFNRRLPPFLPRWRLRSSLTI